MVLFTGVAQAETGGDTYFGISGIRNSTSFTKDNSDANYSNFGGRIFLGKRVNDTVSIEGGFMISPTNTLKVREPDFSMDYATLTSAADAGLVITPVQAASGLKVKVGLAMMHVSLDKKAQRRNSSSAVTAHMIAPGVVAGIAYEHPLTDNVFANVGYTHYHQFSSSKELNMTPLDHDHDVLSIGIQKQF